MVFVTDGDDWALQCVITPTGYFFGGQSVYFVVSPTALVDAVLNRLVEFGWR